MDWESTLRACNQNLGGRTDESWREARADFEIPPPLWGKSPRTGWNPPAVQARLYKNGVVVTGVFVRANTNLQRLAPQDLPGDVVYGLDPWFSKDPEELLEIAESVFETQDAEDEDGAAGTTAATLPEKSEYVRAFEVPRTLARNHQVFMTSVIVSRKHLPAAFMVESTVPLLVDPDDVGTCMVLPSRYWPVELVDAWKECEPDPPCTDHEAVVIKGYGWPVPVIGFGALLVTQLAAEAITGEALVYKDSPWLPSLGLVVASMALLAFARFEARRPPRRYLEPECGHHVDVTFDRRVLWLKPRTWGWIVLGFAVMYPLMKLLP